MQKYNGMEPINLGGGTDMSIEELARLVKEIVGYEGELRFDTSHPDGMPLKVLDSSPLMTMGWRPKVLFQEALSATYEGFLQVQQKLTR